MIWGADELPIGHEVTIEGGTIAFVDMTLSRKTGQRHLVIVDVFKGDVLMPIMCDLRQLGLPKQQLRAIQRPKHATRLMLVTGDELARAKARDEAPMQPHVGLLTAALIAGPVPTVVAEPALFGPYAGHRVLVVDRSFRGRVALEDLGR